MDIEHNNAQKYKELGNQAYKAQDYHKALKLYTKAIEADPNDPNFYSNRALCFFNLSLFEECVKDCDRCLGLNPSNSKAHRKKSSACINLLRFDEAVEALKAAYSFQKSLTLNNQLEEAESLKSNYQRYLDAERRNDYAQALSCITYLVGKIPTNKTLKLFKIECLAKTGETSEAKNILNSMQSDNTPEFYYLKGMIQLYNGDSVKAKRCFTQGIRLDPENAKCQKALNKAKKCEKFKQQGNQFIKQKKYKEAQMKYTQALNLDPFNKKLNSVIFSNRALTFMKRGEKIRALEDLNKSLQLDPNYLKSLVRRAELNMEREDYAAALNDYSKIQQVDPSIDLKSKIQLANKKEKQAKKKDYYAILGVPRTANEAQIKKAYKSLALKYHPDRNRGKSEVQQEEASKKFKDIVEAHGVLTDVQKKKMYDSGQMQYDGDQGAHFSENMGSNFGSNFQSGNMGDGMKYTFSSNDMGGMGGMGGKGGMNGMGGIDPSKIFQMFFAGQGMGGGMGAGMGREGTRQSRNGSRPKGFGGFNEFGSQNNFSGFNFM